MKFLLVILGLYIASCGPEKTEGNEELSKDPLAAETDEGDEDTDVSGDDGTTDTTDTMDTSDDNTIDPNKPHPLGFKNMDFTTDEDTKLDFTLAHPSEWPAGWAMGSKALPVIGILLLDGSQPGSFSYEPAADFSGEVSASLFAYNLANPQDIYDFTVTITVNPVNDAPVAEDDVYSIPEDAPANFKPLDNDSDIEEDTLTITAVSGDAGYGTLTIAADGLSIDFVPTPNLNGNFLITYTVSDGNGGEATGEIAVTIEADADSPIAAADAVTITEDANITIDVLANDSSPDSFTLTLESVGPLSQGMGAVAINAGEVEFTHVPNFSGTVVFPYTIKDSEDKQSVGTVTITVTEVNDVPVAIDDNVTLYFAQNTSVDLTANDTDVDVGDTLEISSVGTVAGVTFTINAVNPAILDIDATTATGTFAVPIEIIDVAGATANSVLNLTIKHVPTPLPFIVIDLAGGAGFAGSNIVVGGSGGQTDYLPAGSYQSLGLRPEGEPSQVGKTNNSLGLLFQTDSELLAGIIANTSPGTQSKTDGAIFAARSADDTRTNKSSPVYYVAKARSEENMLAYVVGTDNSIRSGGNSDVPDDSYDATKPMVHVYTDDDAKALAAGTVTANDLDPLLDSSITTAFGISAGSSATEKGRAAIAKLILDGYVAAGSIRLGGYDYHGNIANSIDQDDFDAGALVGKILEAAALKGKAVMVYVMTDGGVSSSTVAGNDERYRWSNDSGVRGSSWYLIYKPDGRPTVSATGRQINYFTSTGAVYTDGDSSDDISNNVENLAKAVFLNYLTLSGSVNIYDSIVTSDPLSGNHDDFIAFDAPANLTWASADAVFQAKCVGCHSPGALDLNNQTASEAKVFTIYDRVRGIGNLMPPGGPLTPGEIDTLWRWTGSFR